jgi:hypothetical protein
MTGSIGSTPLPYICNDVWDLSLRRKDMDESDVIIVTESLTLSSERLEGTHMLNDKPMHSRDVIDLPTVSILRLPRAYLRAFT